MASLCPLVLLSIVAYLTNAKGITEFHKMAEIMQSAFDRQRLASWMKLSQFHLPLCG